MQGPSPRELLGGALLSLTLASACAGGPPVTARAAMLVDHGRPDEAESLLRAHLKEDPNDIEARRELIRVLGVERRPDQAEREAAVLAQSLGEQSPVPFIEAGHAYELSHHYAEALALYDRAAAVAPADAIGPRTGGMRAARWGELDWAEPRLAEAARRDPRDARTWHALGLVRVHQGRLMEAKSAYRAGLVADGRSFENRIGLATVALQSDQLIEALNQYDQLAATWPERGDVQLGRAFVLWRLGRIEIAAEALQRARAHGADPVIAERLERAFSEQGRASAPH